MPGTVPGVVQAKLPAGVEAPPLNAEEARVWPDAIPLAAGHADTMEVALFIVTLAVPVIVL
jgi:hypothetical protein